MNTATKTTLHPTRFPELSYTHDALRVWRFVDMKSVKPDGERPRIGPIYPTKESLLADLARFADVYGCG